MSSFAVLPPAAATAAARPASDASDAAELPTPSQRVLTIVATVIASSDFGVQLRPHWLPYPAESSRITTAKKTQVTMRAPIGCGHDETVMRKRDDAFVIAALIARRIVHM